MIVLDSSVAIEAVLDTAVLAELRGRLQPGDSLHAPHLIDVEVLHVLRRKLRHRELTPQRCTEALYDFRSLPIIRYSHHRFIDRVWSLRENVSAYDAVYVALAEMLRVPLLTTDARLARSSGHRAAIELLAR